LLNTKMKNEKMYIGGKVGRRESGKEY